MNLLRAARVIARRDYVATVWSRTFLLFLVGPLFPILFGALFGTVGAKMKPPATPAVIALVASPEQAASLKAAHERLTAAANLPTMRIVPPDGVDVAALLRDPAIAVVVTGVPDKPVVHGNAAAIAANRDKVALLLDEAAHNPRRPPAVAEAKVARRQVDETAGRTSLARGGQLLLVMLTMILAGMLLSNLIEEKSNKVIEVLAAAVPVDAIFVGKLTAMLGMSLTGIFVWATLAIGSILAFAPWAFAHLATPAVGWPVFIALGVIYFIASYLLIGALFLGIGAQAGSVREVQTLSMPATMAQLIFFWLASAGIDDPGGPIGVAATIIPWSSPFAMLAEAARDARLWPHLLAICWQMLSIGSIIWLGSRMFRRSVLKSGGSLFRRRRA